MNLSRNTEKAREFMTSNSLPANWEITTDGSGRYLKVTDTADQNRVMYHADKWPELVAFCEGFGLGRNHPREEVKS